MSELRLTMPDACRLGQVKMSTCERVLEQSVSPATPGRPPYEHEVVKRWTAAIAQSDGFIFVTPEYNYGPAAVLKNAIDCVAEGRIRGLKASARV